MVRVCIFDKLLLYIKLCPKEVSVKNEKKIITCKKIQEDGALLDYHFQVPAVTGHLVLLHPVVLATCSPSPCKPTSPGHYTHQGDLFVYWPREGGVRGVRHVAEGNRKCLVTTTLMLQLSVFTVLKAPMTT